MTTKRAEESGSGRPSERFSGMPMPFGHCGQLMSPPRSAPGSRGFGSAGTVIDGVGAAGVASADGAEVGSEALAVGEGATDVEGEACASAFFESGASGASQPVATSTTRATTASDAGRVGHRAVRMVSPGWHVSDPRRSGPPRDWQQTRGGGRIVA